MIKVLDQIACSCDLYRVASTQAAAWDSEWGMKKERYYVLGLLAERSSGDDTMMLSTACASRKEYAGYRFIEQVR